MTASKLEASELIARYLEDNYLLDGVDILPDEYHYSCLPLCLLDAVFSIGVRYSSTQNAVYHYCEYVGIPKYREKDGGAEINHSLVEMLAAYEAIGSPARFAKEIVMNEQLTSSRGGILKAEAVKLCAEVLERGGITTIAEFQDKLTPSIEQKFRDIKGQSSGISLRYLKMLCGKDNEAKPDRHVLRFLTRFVDKEPDTDEAIELLSSVTNRLKLDHPSITMREIDYLIWSEMSQQ